ncbi:hypothetical protein FA15DRAFT_642423 [Coprinopsis marcescibilis]|uniref:Uncharacterized protein n=1 Tax=Coprinopsis marcescibilis TaxID=230819 RepID=A0A5C3KSL7_COPMA|nr:hypothetical protein FA15DRAFT_642423 [Coprinopsis marcescibilis]
MIPARKLTFIGLNVVRLLSVVSLMLVFASTILVMVNNIKAVNRFEDLKLEVNGTVEAEELLDCDYIDGSTVPNQPAGVFWAIVASLLIIFQTIILFLSEASWPMTFFLNYFPVLGPNFGLGALGIFQGLIATQILSHHVDDFTLVSAFFLFAVGCINMLLGLIFRQGAKEKRSIRGWRGEQKNLLADKIGNGNPKGGNFYTGNSNPPIYSQNKSSFDEEKGHQFQFQLPERSDSQRTAFTDRSAMGFGRQAEKGGMRQLYLQSPQTPEPTAPRYGSPHPSSKHSNVTRSNTMISYASSFESPDNDAPPQRAADSQPQTPVFKSSNTAF